jgi:t-SNARE complex subunit (syntaxin)
VLARTHVQSKTLEYKNVELKYDEAEKGIKSIADGHRKLLENIDKLSNEEVKTMINNFAKDIKTIRENLQKIRS